MNMVAEAMVEIAKAACAVRELASKLDVLQTVILVGSMAEEEMEAVSSAADLTAELCGRALSAAGAANEMNRSER